MFKKNIGHTPMFYFYSRLFMLYQYKKEYNKNG